MGLRSGPVRSGWALSAVDTISKNLVVFQHKRNDEEKYESVPYPRVTLDERQIAQQAVNGMRAALQSPVADGPRVYTDPERTSDPLRMMRVGRSGVAHHQISTYQVNVDSLMDNGALISADHVQQFVPWCRINPTERFLVHAMLEHIERALQN
jgi:hypothetical protein